jgi:hypothetical protein
VLLKRIFFIQLKLQRRLQYEKFEDKGQSVAVNRSKSDNTMAVRKGTSKDPQSTTQKSKDRAIRTPLFMGELRCSGKVSSSCSTSAICDVNVRMDIN